MTEQLPLPKFNNKNELDDSPLAPVELSADKLCNILTNMVRIKNLAAIIITITYYINCTIQVRQKYFDFLEKLLADNYENTPSDAVLSSQDIKKCAEYLVSELLLLAISAN